MCVRVRYAFVASRLCSQHAPRAQALTFSTSVLSRHPQHLCATMALAHGIDAKVVDRVSPTLSLTLFSILRHPGPPS